ncbi:MAG: rhodanese-related sulfurtransferase [Chloroflexota bacterium]
MSRIIIVALYKFVDLPDFESLQAPILEKANHHRLKGTLLLAHEGINGTIAGERKEMDLFLTFLQSDSRLSDLLWKASFANEPPFHRMKVKLKKEIVTIGMPEIDPIERVGTYVEPKAWNDLIQDPDVTVIDTRNDYEFGVGTFERALNPETFSFREFPEYVKNNLSPKTHKKVAMFCTGGIRCEKATSLLLGMGFEEVYHLKGGILKYLEEVPQEESLWQGECFVFDDRVTVDHHLEPGSYKMCFACKMPLSLEETKHPSYQEGVSCQHCIDDTTAEKRERFAERHKQVKLAEARGERHIGK